MKRLFFKLDKISTIEVRRNARKCLMIVPFKVHMNHPFPLEGQPRILFPREEHGAHFLNPLPQAIMIHKLSCQDLRQAFQKATVRRGTVSQPFPSIKTVSRREVSELFGSFWSSLD